MEKYDNIFWKVYRWFRWDWKHFHKYLYYGIKNLITWFPVIWKDRDWDDYYILEILKFKINKTANSFEKKQRFVGWEDQVRYMRICEKLITLIQDEYYSHEYFDYYDNKFSFEKTEDSDLFELKSEVIKDDLQTYIQKYSHANRVALINPKYSVFINSMSGSPNVGMAIAIGMVRHNKAKKLLFNILENKIDYWWD
jgi:hypothetical protein